jgi:transcriptional regulator with XRE-family HTH domain
MYRILTAMPKTHPPIFPATAKQLAALGERLRLARLRRRYSAESVAVRAGITRVTLARVEKGDTGTSMGAYVAVLRVLGLQSDLDGIARDDQLGRKLQDLDMSVGRTAPRRRAGGSPQGAESKEHPTAGPGKGR